jgi:solute:Na+ symporter, SSS family
LASIVVFPDVGSIAEKFPDIKVDLLKEDLAFPAMLSLLPKGLLGIVIASLIAALMSTLSTHLNWGSSYVVNDVYLRFIKPRATQKELVVIGRLSTILLMVMAAIFSLYLKNALQAFSILLQIGAGTGLIFILRWFWWRVNAAGEISAMLGSFIIALYFEFFYTGNLQSHEKLVVGVFITTVIWIFVILVTKPTNPDVLKSFYILIKPNSYGWKKVIKDMSIEQQNQLSSSSSLGKEISMMILACFGVYSMLFGVGFLLYKNTIGYTICFAMIILIFILLKNIWKHEYNGKASAYLSEKH